MKFLITDFPFKATVVGVHSLTNTMAAITQNVTQPQTLQTGLQADLRFCQTQWSPIDFVSGYICSLLGLTTRINYQQMVVQVFFKIPHALI